MFLDLTTHGARVAVNDLGSDERGSGGSNLPVREVVEAIRTNGGQAVAVRKGGGVIGFEEAACSVIILEKDR